MARDTLRFQNVNIDIEGLADGRISFIAAAFWGHTIFELNACEIKSLAEVLNDFSARSAPVCDEAEG